MLASTTDIIGIVTVVAISGIGLAAWFVSRCVKIVQQARGETPAASAPTGY